MENSEQRSDPVLLSVLQKTQQKRITTELLTPADQTSSLRSQTSAV